MNNPEKIEIAGLKTIHKLCKFGADRNMEGCSFTEIVERMFDELAKSQAVPECVWVESYDGSVFESSCGHTFELSNNGTLDDNNMKHCCFCGGKIEAQEQSHESE